MEKGNVLDLTAAQMIDIASMKAIYAHLENDENIELALEVKGEEKDLAEIGQWMIDGDLDKFEEAFINGRIKPYIDFNISLGTAIYCLYVPPYYVFVNLKKPYI